MFEIRKRVGMVFQNPDNQLIASIVEDDIAFGPENLGVPREEIGKRIDFALSAVGMERRNLHTIILSELGILLLFVFITAAVTARLLMILISQAMYSLIGTTLTLNAAQTAVILFISLVVLLCLISLVTSLNMWSLRRKPAAELMKS